MAVQFHNKWLFAAIISGVVIFSLASAVTTGNVPVFRDGFEAPEPVTGRILLSLTMPIPEESRATLIANTAILEAEGYTVAKDGSSVGFPDSSPAGWLVQFGPLETLAAKDGSFELNLAGVTEVTGAIYHPSHEDDVAVGSFSRSDLVPTGEIPVPVVLKMPFTGPCNMTVGPTNPAHCQVNTVSGTDSEIVASLGLEGSKLPIPIPLDTYPPTPRESNCQILDGWVSEDTDALLAYFGSTCSIQVVRGLCPNEGGWGIFKSEICCFKNHRGRFCQSVKLGDMKLLDLFQDPAENPVTLDQTTTFTVHNNANWGETIVDPWLEKGIGGQMPAQGDYFGGEGTRIEHFDPVKLAAYDCSGSHPADIYVADRVVTYKTPRCLLKPPADDAKDQYFLTTRDGRGAVFTMTFRLEQGNLWQFENGGAVFDLNQALELRGSRISNPEPIGEDSGCSGIHIHGAHPCTGAPDPEPSKCGHGIVTLLDGA